MMIQIAVITAAGSGSRLLPATKVMSKEMFPLFSVGQTGKLVVKPIAQLVFEQLFEAGIRKFFFIVNYEKTDILRHFTINEPFLNFVQNCDPETQQDLLDFSEKLNVSSLRYVYQFKPLGFGDAILKVEPFIDDPFVVQAGDTHVLSNNRYHSILFSTFQRYDCAATFLVKEVVNPQSFGVIEGDAIEPNVYRVRNVIEKPKYPSSNLAVVGIYMFNPIIFEALRMNSHDGSGELQLTDGIQRLIDSQYSVTAVKIDDDTEIWLDTGQPQTYWKALYQSHQHSLKKRIPALSV